MLDWTGAAEFLAGIEAAAELAVDATAREASEYARSHHEWQSRTGEAEADIFVESAKNDAGEVKAQFGDHSDHAIFLEFGTIHMEPRPFLRPALDATTPGLIDKMRRHA